MLRTKKCSDIFVQSFSGAGGGCSFNRMPDNLLHTRLNFNIAFLKNDLPRNMLLERDKIDDCDISLPKERLVEIGVG
jgi:hypothetical protein